MLKKIFSTTSLLCIALMACKHKTKEPATSSIGKEWSELPKVTRLDSLYQTDFVATLENPFDYTRNTIYASALLYAWDSLIKLLPADIINDTGYTKEFNLFRKSASYKNSLSRDEYSISAGIETNLIVVEAFFNKTLPFPSKMEKSEKPIIFEGQNVKAFGMYESDMDILKYSQLLFYDNDDRFLLRFFLKDQNHELWLMKAEDTDSTLGAVVKRAKAWKAVGETEAGNQKLAWKYSFNENDLFSIPEIKFNIDYFYKSLEGGLFLSNGQQRYVVSTYQRTGFILNETGAVAESHAIMVTDTTASAPEEQALPKPKNLVFDKPFYIILKRTDSENPYFVMRVANAELLVKQQ